MASRTISTAISRRDLIEVEDLEWAKLLGERRLELLPLGEPDRPVG
jgi:hypothetical protein